MKYTVSLSVASIFVSLCSVYGFPSEIDEPGKMSTGWGSGSGWVAPTNGTSIASGETLIVTGFESHMNTTDHTGIGLSSDDGTLAANNTMANHLYGDLYTGATAVNFIGALAGANYTELEGTSDNFSQTVATASDFDNATYSANPYNNASMQAGSFIGSNYAIVTNGTNMNGGGGGWGSGDSGWRKVEPIKLY